MAKIHKRNARKNLEDGPISAVSAYNMGGLIFRFTVGDHEISITHVERDKLIGDWARLEKEWES